MIGVFRPVDLDQRIVDPEAGERGHQMLDGGDTVAPARSPITVQSDVCVTLRHSASIRRSRPSGRPVRRKTTPVIGRRRDEGQLGRGPRSERRALNFHTIAQRRLKAQTSHQLHPDFRPARFAPSAAMRSVKLPTDTATKAADRRPPAAAKKPDVSS